MNVRARSRADWLAAAEAAALLWLATPVVLLAPFRWVVAALRLRQAGEPLATDTSPAARQVAWALTAAAARMPWRPTCLVQAVAATAMLRRRGLPAALVLGVARDASAGVAAHAWVYCGAAVVAGGSGKERFNPISTFVWTPPEPARG